MKTIRSFIAIDYPAEVKRNILAVIQQYKQHIKPGFVHWVPETNLHLTLKFLGEVEEGKMTTLNGLLLTFAENISAFDFKICGAGLFPNPQRPRILWLGSEPCPELDLLARSIDQLAQKIGVAPEERRFSPHLTIGRVSRDVNDTELRLLGSNFLKTKIDALGIVKVDHITLYRSDLLPTGAKYSTINTIPLHINCTNNFTKTLDN